MDYNEFAEKIKTKYPQYKDMDNRELAARMVEKYPQYNDVTFDTPTPQADKKRGIDLTPSGLINRASGAIGAGLAAPIVAAKENIPLKDAYNSALERGNEFRANDKLSGVRDFVTDMAFYSQLPVLRGTTLPTKIGAFAGNAAIQGGGVGALESLKREGDLSGFGSGTGIAAGIQSLPYVGRLAKPILNLVPQSGNLIARSLGRIQPETLQRAVQADSKALDLTKDSAQNLLMDTTERIQKDYKNLLDNAGLDVQKAALNLPEDRGVFASSLKNSLDDIYNGYSTSGQRELNPAFNNAGDIYDDITNLIDSGVDKTGLRVPAKNLNDIMGNIKNYPLDWSKTSTKDRQTILKQIYGDFQRRLGNLSPELRKANAKYSKLARFDDNEGVKSIINPNVIKGENIDSASRALRNYNSTVTSGNKNRNIQDLEKILVANGKEPFLNDIHDVNAAMDLLNARSTGDSWLANLTTNLTRPVLKGVRYANQIGLPERIRNAQEVAREPIQRLLNPLVVRTAAPLLYGGISNDEEY